MASGTISTRPQAESAPNGGRYEDFIQKRLEHTRRQVRLVDVGSNLILLAAASLFFFLVVAVADHWVFAHGLNFFARLLLWGIWVAVAGTFAWRFVAPSVMHRINPVFAAQAIEHGRPTLKNSLINFLLLRSHPEDVAPVVYRAMEHRAAADLSKVPVEHAVDHRRLIHLTYIFAAAVALFTLYLALSPKNPLVSAARVLWPWASIPAPTRVHIEDVRPGDAVVFRGDTQTISAHVAGLRDGEDVALLVSTADGQVVDDRMIMTRAGDDDRYSCDLPGGSGGLQQDTLYRITAGDATTQQYKLNVQIAPTIIVDQIDYHFPAYTGYRDRTIKGQDDIKALEGTRVTIHATSNLEIKDARIDLGCNGLRMLPMTHAGTKATGEFALALDPENPGQPQFKDYQIQFTDVDDHEARHLIRHQIEVDRDLPPDIAIVEPKPEETSVAERGHLRIRVHAIDPDFALRRVTLHAEQGDRRLDLPVLLDRVPPEKALVGAFDSDYDFQPAEFSLKAGDQVKYWAAAEDNKEPRHNHSETAPRTIKIVATEQEAKQDRQEAGQQAKNDEQNGDGKSQQGGGKPQPGQNGQGQDSNDGAAQGDNTSAPKNGERSKGNPRNGQNGQKNEPSKSDQGKSDDSSSSSDPNNDQGSQPSSSSNSGQGNQSVPPDDIHRTEAMKDIINDAKKQEQQQEKSQPSKDEQKENQPQDKSQDGGKQDAGQQGGQPQNGNQSQNGGQQNKPQQGGQNQSGSPQGGGQGNQQPQDGSGKNNQSSGNSGNSPNSGQSGAGQQQTANSAQENANNKSGTGQQQGEKKTSPEQSGNQSAQQGSGSQPQAGQKPGGEAGNKEQSAQNAANNAGKKPDGSSASGEKSASNSGGANKPDSKQGGAKGNEQNSPAGGSPSSKEKQGGTGQQQTGNQASGGTPNAQKKPTGGQNSSNDNQLAMNGPKNEKKDAASSGGGSNQTTPPGGAKQENKPKPEDGNSSGGGGSQNQTKQEKQEQSGGGGAGGQEKPKPGGEQPSPSGGGSKTSPNGTKNNKPGNMTDGDAGQQKDPGKRGEPTSQTSDGAPTPQSDNAPGEKKTGESNNAGQKPNDPQSPAHGDKTSESKGDTSGDRKGGGAGGGGGDEHSKKNGKGTPGSHSIGGEDGGKPSNEQGPGATGGKGGETTQTTDNASSPKKEAGAGSGQKPQSADQATQKTDSQQPQGNPNPSNESAQQASSGGQGGAQSPQAAGQQGSGQPAGGNPGAGQTTPPPSQHAEQPKPDAPDLEFSKKQVDLALRHLKDEMKKQKPELLDHLGWTKEEAQKFYDNISKLRDAAQQPNDPEANKAYNEFLKNLDLHPHGTRLGGNSTRKDNATNVIDAGQMAAPPEYQDLTNAYSRSIAGQK